MSEHSTFELGYTSPLRAKETVLIDDSISHIDILLPFAEESFMDGFRWVNSMRKALRLHRIDRRSLVLSDLSSIKGDHLTEHLAQGVEDDMPYDVMDIVDEEAAIYGREHNPANLELLANPLVSREHIKIMPHLGATGLKLSFTDERSTNGSCLVVVRHTTGSTLPAYDNLFVA